MTVTPSTSWWPVLRLIKTNPRRGHRCVREQNLGSGIQVIIGLKERPPRLVYSKIAQNQLV